VRVKEREREERSFPMDGSSCTAGYDFSTIVIGGSRYLGYVQCNAMQSSVCVVGVPIFGFFFSNPRSHAKIAVTIPEFEI
jgi:hypothetical protein